MPFKKNIEIAIIIPVYNAERYIKRCINSIIQQKYSYFKVILINDGSTDHSLQLCEEFQNNDIRISVHTQKNSGVSAARNKGLSICSSPFCCFVDADDYLEPDFLSNFIEGLSDNTDMVFQGINRIFDNKKKEEIKPLKGIYPKEQLLNGISDINKFSIFGYVCTKLYKTEIIKQNNLWFNERISISEDRIFSLQYLKYCNELSVINKSAYNYIIHNNGLTTLKRNYKEIKEAAEKNLACAIDLFYLPNNDRFKIDTYRMYILSSFGYLTALFNSNENFITQKNEIKNYINSYSKWLHFYKPNNKYYSLLHKILKIKNSFIITILLRTYWWLKNKKNKYYQNASISK